MPDVIVGIDLGTTAYSIAHFSGDVAQPLEEVGLDRTPCYVCYRYRSQPDPEVGVHAKREEHNDTKSFAVYEPKRLIGRQYEDEKVQALIPWLTYSLEEDANGLKIVIDREGGKITTSLASIYQIIFKKMKEAIGSRLRKINRIKAVITVPPNFTIEQRNATISAAENVGFRVLELLEEPSAIAYFHFTRYDISLHQDTHFLVYDFGASDFKIGIFKVSGSSFNNVGSASNTGVSGKAFDFIIFNHIAGYLMREYNFDVKPDKNLVRKLLLDSEDAKTDLSVLPATSINLQNKIPGKTVNNLRITRSEFEVLAQNLLQESVQIVDECLDAHNLSKKAMKKVILCGGASRIPKIQDLLLGYFGNILIFNKDYVFEDTTFAEGAALYAKVLTVS